MKEDFFKDKVVLIVGASSGIGWHTAKLLIENGAKVYNASRNPSDLGGIINLTMDIVNPESVNEAFAKINEREEKIDFLINSAGFSLAAPFEHTTETDYRYLFDVNYFGAVNVIQHALPLMKKNGGKILNISSVASSSPIVFDSFYSSSKAALNMLSVELNLELDKYGIQICSVQPGGTQTSFTAARKVYTQKKNTEGYEEELQDSVKKLAEIEQNGMKPEKVAEHILNLLEKEKLPAISTVGMKNKMMFMATKIMPTGLLISLSRKKYKLR